MIIQRYTWEDTVVKAQAAGLISNGALMVCLKLATAINWEPKGKRAGMPSGLYWKNEDALKSVGCSRASYFKHRTELFEIGLFTTINGNLIPQVPQSLVETIDAILELRESLVETLQSPVETTESLVETEQSPVDNPYSEDNTVKRYSEDISSEDSIAGAKAPALPAGGGEPSTSSDFFTFPDYKDSSDLETSSCYSVQDIRQSLLETGLEDKKEYFNGWLAAGKPGTLEEWVVEKKNQYDW